MKQPAFSTTGTENKKIDVQFTGGKLTSDAGAVLLHEIDRSLRLSERINEIIFDPRNPDFTTHKQRDLIAQRIFSIALGYEDLNDQTNLRTDPALLGAVKNHTDEEQPLGSSPTLCRFENRVTDDEIVRLSKLFVELFIESFDSPPKSITLDVDATDDPTHGDQEGTVFNAFYDHYCFLPIYFFCGDQLLWAQLRTSKTGGAHGARAIFKRITDRLREVWPDTEIILRGDAGFYSVELLDYCERHGFKYILGYSSNAVLKRKTASLVIATKLFFKDADSKESFRMYDTILDYKAGSWHSARKMIVKAERLPDGENLDGKENTRYLVTNLEGSAQYLYEDVYCARGDMENRIKEQQQMLFADRTSCHDFRANRFRLLLSSFSYVLLETMRRTALKGTKLEKAQCSTIRTKLLKIAAVVKESSRRILYELPSSFPLSELWVLVAERLQRLRRCESG